MERRRRRTTVGASSTEAVQLDELQYGFHDGPCLTAARTGKTVLVDDAAEDDRWPPYLAAVPGSGHASILAVPIPLEGEAKAALNCHAVRARAFDPEIVAAAESHAALAARAVILAVRIDGQARRSEDLQAALQSRTVIDLAVGIVMGRNRCSQDSAFNILRSASSTRNLKLRDVCAEVVATVAEPARTHFDG